MRSTVRLLFFVVGVSLTFSGSALAAGYCPNRPGGKCPSAKVVKPDSSSNYTSEEREKMQEKFRVLCKKKYGAQSKLVSVDYRKRKYICSDGPYF